MVVPLFSKDALLRLWVPVVTVIVLVVAGMVAWSAFVGSRSGEILYDVSGDSMSPTFTSGQTLTIEQSPEYAQGQIVVFTAPRTWSRSNNRELIKRIHAVSGDTVTFDHGNFRVNGHLVRQLSPNYAQTCHITEPYSHQLQDKELFVLGDNAQHSTDSAAALCEEKSSPYVSTDDVLTHGQATIVTEQ